MRFSASQTVEAPPNPNLAIVLNLPSKTWPAVVGWKYLNAFPGSNSSSIGSLMTSLVNAADEKKRDLTYPGLGQFPRRNKRRGEELNVLIVAMMSSVEGERAKFLLHVGGAVG